MKKTFDIFKKKCYINFSIWLWGCSSGVEHLPFKQGVDGSSPSILTKDPAMQDFLVIYVKRKNKVLVEHPDKSGGSGSRTRPSSQKILQCRIF
jgi:hypothetical protein